MTRFGLSGKFLAQPGQRDALVDILLEAADALEADPSCHSYVVNTIDGEPDAVWISETWTDETAHKASLQNEKIRSIVQRGMPLVAGVANQIRLNPVGGKGLS